MLCVAHLPNTPPLHCAQHLPYCAGEASRDAQRRRGRAQQSSELQRQRGQIQ